MSEKPALGVISPEDFGMVCDLHCLTQPLLQHKVKLKRDEVQNHMAAESYV